MRRTLSRSQSIQLWITCLLTATYALLAVGLGGEPLIAGVGLLLIATATGLGYWLGPKQDVGKEPLLVWFIGYMTMFVAAFGADYPSFGTAIAVSTLGIFCVLAGYSIWRVPLPAERYDLSSMGASIIGGIRSGASMSVGVAVFATIIFLVAAAFAGNGAESEPMFSLRGYALLMLAYVSAGVSAGFIVGILKPLARWPLGAMLIGIPVATVVYGSVMLVLLLVGEPDAPQSLGEAGWMALGIGCVAGPMAGLFFRNGFPKAG